MGRAAAVDASTALGAAAGAATGGVVGALTKAGVSKEDASLYAEGVGRGGTLVTGRVADADHARFDAVLDQSAVIFGTGARLGRNLDGTRSILPASHTVLKMSARNASFTALECVE
jgi:hypothetical protein